MNWPVAKRTVQSNTFLLQMIRITFLGQTSFKDLFSHMPNLSRVDWLLQAHGYSLDIDIFVGPDSCREDGHLVRYNNCS